MNLNEDQLEIGDSVVLVSHNLQANVSNTSKNMVQPWILFLN